ncbi:MAG: hypothetical protein HGB11_14625 [Chlorobiales bacterium]|nr:hypothetical protein [Chlorobiales bacterium]
MSLFLYRGFGIGIYPTVVASLTPKAPGRFSYVFTYGDGITYDGSATYGISDQNAVLRHQLHQAGLPTAGVSTSPHKDRAVFYALGAGKHREGVVLVIDRSKLVEYGVREYVVSSSVVQPSVPEDDEVILVGINGGPLPIEIVVMQECVCA